MTALEFFVAGVAKPQGSKRHVGGGVMVESCKALKPWREVVAYTAAQAVGSVVLVPFAQPVRLLLAFEFIRPAGHFGAKGLKPSAPAHPTSRQLGDADKLARAVCDALTGIVFVDDSQVVDLHVFKRYAERTGLVVRVEGA